MPVSSRLAPGGLPGFKPYIAGYGISLLDPCITVPTAASGLAATCRLVVNFRNER
jgi:hypothetical protein